MELLTELFGLGLFAVIATFGIMIIHAVLKWFLKSEPPYTDIIRRNYKAELNQGRITSDTKSIDFLNRINDERRALASTLYYGNMEPADIGLQQWIDSREHMAGIILAVTNMAEYYNINIIEEMRLNALQNEADARS